MLTIKTYKKEKENFYKIDIFFNFEGVDVTMFAVWLTSLIEFFPLIKVYDMSPV